jgi:hypothetical protein
MTILISLYKLNISGSATYTLTVCNELKKRNYSVIVYAPIISDLYSKFKDNNINVVNNLEEIKDINFDIILSQHNVTSVLLRSYFQGVPMIYISHGVIPILEQPSNIDLNISNFIAISEEVKNNLINNYSIQDSKVFIIRNAVNTKKFNCDREINKDLKNILFLTHHKKLHILKNIIKACEQKKLNLEIVGIKKREIDVKQYINNADLVISIGRGVLEAMSCKRAVLVYDYHGGDNLIIEENIKKTKKVNFSGRYNSFNYNVEDLKKIFSFYKKEMGEKNRQIIKKEFDIKLIVNQLEEIIEKSKNDFKERKIFISDEEIVKIKNKIAIDNSKQIKKKNFISKLKIFIFNLLFKGMKKNNKLAYFVALSIIFLRGK